MGRKKSSSSKRRARSSIDPNTPTVEKLTLEAINERVKAYAHAWYDILRPKATPENLCDHHKVASGFCYRDFTRAGSYYEVCGTAKCKKKKIQYRTAKLPEEIVAKIMEYKDAVELEYNLQRDLQTYVCSSRHRGSSGRGISKTHRSPTPPSSSPEASEEVGISSDTSIIEEHLGGSSKRVENEITVYLFAEDDVPPVDFDLKVPYGTKFLNDTFYEVLEMMEIKRLDEVDVLSTKTKEWNRRMVVEVELTDPVIVARIGVDRLAFQDIKGLKPFKRALAAKPKRGERGKGKPAKDSESDKEED